LPEVSDEVGPGAAAPSWRDITIQPYRRRRDWRWWVGLVGRVLVATGLLLLAFVGYQLWGTGIQTRQAQNRLEQEFTAALPPTTTTTTAPPTTAPSSTDAPATSTTVAPTTTTLPPPPVPPALGDPIARLEAPTIGLDWIVVSGVGVDELKKGPGHYPDTPLPGQNGNIGIAGHRTTYGAPFFRIDELAAGDEVILTSSSGGRFVYRVTDQFIVSPSQYDVLAPSTTPILTLTSCHPRYSAKQRIIVRAALDPAQSSPLADAAPATTTTTAAPVVTEPTTAPTTEADGATVVPSSSAPTTTPSTTLAGGVRQPAVIGGPELQRGWFDDPDAWPQVAFWGLGLIAVSLVAWRISRRSRRNWIGAAAGIVPFLFVLYFFFENVNRLLPPNI
jgi:sortase A